jgi:hypothetical protein
MRPLKFLNDCMRPDKNLNDCMRPEYHNSTHYWGDETQHLYVVSPTNL